MLQYLYLQAFMWRLLKGGFPLSISETALKYVEYKIVPDLCALGFLPIFSSPVPQGSCGEWFV